MKMSILFIMLIWFHFPSRTWRGALSVGHSVDYVAKAGSNAALATGAVY